MKTRYMTILTTLVLLGFTVSTFAARPSGGGGTTPEYSAALIMGGFRFNPVAITLNRGSYSSALELNMARPDLTVDPPSGQVKWNVDDEGINIDQLMWDEVFLECYEVFNGADIGDLTVGTSWGITQGGTNKKGSKIGTNIRITFRDVVVVGDDFPNVDVFFSLFTREEYPRALFVPEKVGVPSYYPLDMVNIFGDDNDNQTSCHSGEFTLQSGTVLLEITRVK